MCKEEGCDKEVRTRGLCAACYSKWWRSGKFKHFGTPKTLKDKPAYRTAHQRVQNKWGKASEHFCLVGPAHKADDWACVVEFVEAENLLYRTNHNGKGLEFPYSTNIHDYVPLCKKHHAVENKDGFAGLLLRGDL